MSEISQIIDIEVPPNANFEQGVLIALELYNFVMDSRIDCMHSMIHIGEHDMANTVRSMLENIPLAHIVSSIGENEFEEYDEDGTERQEAYNRLYSWFGYTLDHAFKN